MMLRGCSGQLSGGVVLAVGKGLLEESSSKGPAQSGATAAMPSHSSNEGSARVTSANGVW